MCWSSCSEIWHGHSYDQNLDQEHPRFVHWGSKYSIWALGTDFWPTSTCYVALGGQHSLARLGLGPNQKLESWFLPKNSLPRRRAQRWPRTLPPCSLSLDRSCLLLLGSVGMVGEIFPQGNHRPAAFKGVNGSTTTCQPKSTKILGARPTCSNPGPPACGRVGLTSEGVTGLGLMGKEWGFHQLMLWNCRHIFCTPSLFSSAYVPLIVDRGRRKWAGVKMDSAQKASSKQRRRQGGAARRSPVPDSGVPSCWFLLCCIFWAMTWVSTEISPNHSTSPCGCCVFAFALLPKAGKLMLPGCNQLSWQELERQTERATGMP